MASMKGVAKFWNGLPPIAKGVLAVAGTYGIYKGVKYLRNRVPHVPLPNAGQGIPVVGYDAAGTAVSWSPDKIVGDLYDAMDGLLTFTGTKDAAWQEVIDLASADMLTATYNAFNKDSRSGGKSLTTWIDDEYYYDYFSGVKDLVLQKLRSANLT